MVQCSCRTINPIPKIWISSETQNISVIFPFIRCVYRPYKSVLKCSFKLLMTSQSRFISLRSNTASYRCAKLTAECLLSKCSVTEFQASGSQPKQTVAVLVIRIRYPLYEKYDSAGSFRNFSLRNLSPDLRWSVWTEIWTLSLDYDQHKMSCFDPQMMNEQGNLWQ